MELKVASIPDRDYRPDYFRDVFIRFDRARSAECFIDWWLNSGRYIFYQDYDFSEKLLLSKTEVLSMTQTRIEQLANDIGCPVSAGATLDDTRLMVWLWLKELKDGNQSLAAPGTDARCDQASD